MRTDPILLIDFANLAYRSHFAFANLTDSQNRPTGVYYGVLRAVLSLRKLSHRLVFCWDQGLPGDRKVTPWRSRISKSYKANRGTPDPGVQRVKEEQLPELLRVLRMLGYPCVGVPGLEADDVIGILSEDPSTSSKVLIYSSDKDFFQLLKRDLVEVIRPRVGKADVRVTAASLFKDCGVYPDRWAEYLALSGDGTDNVKAVAGWGPKKALKLLAAGVDLNIDLDQQPEKFQADISLHWNKITEAYELTRIPTSKKDGRISKYMNGYKLPVLSIYDAPEPEAGAYDGFTAFCAEHGMVEFLSNRHEFFKE